jgi:hypothetical protein
LHEREAHFDAYADRAPKHAELETPGAPITGQACAMEMTNRRWVAAIAGIGYERSSAARVNATDIAQQLRILFSGPPAAQSEPGISRR